MDALLKKILEAPGVSGYESEIAGLLSAELKKTCSHVETDAFGNVIARKGKGAKKIMIAAHMDEIGLVVKHITKEGYLYFVKVGGIDDRVLIGQRVIVKAHKGDVLGIIGAKPPHMQKEDERKYAVKYEDMFIDIGAATKEDAARRVAVGDPIIFEPSAGVLSGPLEYGKAIDDRIGCYALVEIMKRLRITGAEVYGVATTQEEVGLKGARTASFKIAPDFALVIDTTMAGDTLSMKERESSLRLGQGVAITIMEAGGRGVIVSTPIREMLMQTAVKHKIPYQLDILEGGMTDGAMIYMNREGIPTGVLSIPTRYIHSATGVFHRNDVQAAIDLAVKVIEHVAAKKQ